MHRDTKLGLALGMLVVGFAAAFCFPRDPRPGLRTGTPAATTGEPDPDAELVPIRVYQQPVGNQSLSPTQTGSLSSLNEDLILPADQAFTPRPQSASTSTAQPSPTQVLHAPGMMPIQQAVLAEQIQPTPADAPFEPPVDSAAEDWLTYVVKPGDNLSSIALAFLGSSSRFGDIYAANQSILVSPDALKPGMVLKIPVKKPTDRPDSPAEQNILPESSIPERLAREGEIVPMVDQTVTPVPVEQRPLFERVGTAPFVRK